MSAPNLSHADMKDTTPHDPVRAPSALLMLVLAGALVGCARVPTGSVGIVKHWSGEIATEPVTGFKTTVLDSVIQVDTTETRVPLNGLRPTDANGVLLDALDVVVSFRLVPEKVPSFYIQTKELDSYTDESGRLITTVGLHVMQNIIQHSIQEITKKEVTTELAANLGGYEQAILQQAQSELDRGYPGVFKLVRINVNHFTPPSAIRDQVNAIAALKVESQRIDQAQTLIRKQSELESAKAVLEANALRAAIDTSHLSAEQLIAWRNARAYETQARAIGESATRTIDAARQPATK
jgi:hypothetical protein